MKYHIEEMISQSRVETRISELAKQINKDYAGKELKLIIILKGSIFFACELAKQITIPVKLDFMAVSSYGDGMVSVGKVVVKKELDENIQGEDVLIIEDIIDTGNTLYHLKNLLLARNPQTLRIATLLDKPDCRTVELNPDYCGFEIPDKFVVGYGLDYAQKHRNLPYIGAIIEE